MKEMFKHIPVLVDEAVNGLNIQPNGIYIDGTFGRGGHSRAVLTKLGIRGHLYAMDCDPQAIIAASKIIDSRFTIIHGLFSSMANCVEARGLTRKIDGVLLDFGVSSPQIDDAQRGFSFMRDGPLDMRMDPTYGKSAAMWLGNTKEKEISLVLKTFGEERFANRIARAIIQRNQKRLILRTTDLANVINTAIPCKDKFKHPATRSFQAIRIVINNEINEIKQVLHGALTILKDGGRLSIITFHSLEDRLVKSFIREHSGMIQIPNGLPIPEVQLQRLGKHHLKAICKITPSRSEITHNPRARSAVLRIAERIR
ncbi:16S rRNA (cytosine(1402)-N(4))-methyltransferase RsmH [Candidatus Erwinia haradaeae]|uniref:Ribosomal RNA small subunit methyltransferase H n=1 Tax=Candidatus Erwinia haradaeae TaxID=1922217 RepID=A0A451D9Q7_9GAMM|nr:16S rRNA (cytosine(1402)-N(4))-methyltransferase RsmH [Candidatus Erwinia haradaeae]VFP82966.1 Ribosomal RNA small subunit methyltransferase H [Candidatus Erwinia haradaeae]